MRMTMPAMAVVMAFAANYTGVGTAFGIEWRFDGVAITAKPSGHRLDHMIGPNSQFAALTRGTDLGRQMSIPEMPSDPHKRCGIGTGDRDELFWFRFDDHLTAVCQLEGVAVAQMARPFLIEQKLQPALGAHNRPPSAALIVI